MKGATRGKLGVVGVVVLAAAATSAWLLVRDGSSPRQITTTGGGCDTTSSMPASSTTAALSSPTSSLTQPATTLTSPGSTPPGTALREGARGPAVFELQQRLTAIGYWLGDADGVFGSATTHALVAFQKTQGLRRDGIAGAATADALTRASRPAARSIAGRVIEVDLAHQVLFVVSDGHVDWVIDACTGAVPGSTPAGMFRVFRQVDGYDRGPLGVLYRPKYFSNGVAVHGYPVVPPVPSSHGCVRVTDAAMDWLWERNVMPIGTAVWVY